MRDELKSKLAARYPKLKTYQINSTVDAYINAVMHQVVEQFANMTSDDLVAGEFSFAQDAVAQRCGQVRVDGTRLRVFTMMQSDITTSLVLVTYTGNSITKRVSKVTLNPLYKKEIFNALISE